MLKSLPVHSLGVTFVVSTTMPKQWLICATHKCCSA
jgi:hypothetical protein